MESSFSEAQRGTLVSVSSDPSLHQYLMPNKPMELMESMSGGSLSQSTTVSRMQMGQIDINSGKFAPQFQIPNRQFVGTGPSGNMLRTADELLSLPTKRKASTSMEPPNSFSQQQLMPNKRVAQTEHRPWLQQVSGITKRPLQIQNNAAAPAPLHSPASNKRKVQTESQSTKVGHQRSTTPKGQSAQMNPMSKIQNESSGSIRSKMRESLTAALALVSQQQAKSLNEEKSQLSEVNKSASQKQKNSLPSDPAVGYASEESRKDADSTGLGGNEVEKMSQKSLENVNVIDLETIRYSGQEFQTSNVLSYEDISFGDNFFIKDDLLQENGLSWVLESGFEVADGKETRPVETQKLAANQNQEVKAVQSPESLAFTIEEELCKLFGGVNKKYKEKGRSLLFNLKDRNNPELRERVMRGEISPKRLCSMTAEELASKELSEWRMAKAEELAQMVVLPDSEVDIRRLVKKTHKGEFQVEVEHFDNSSTDVSAGTASFSQSQRNKNETEGVSSDEPESTKDEQKNSGHKNGAEDKDNYTFTIASNDGSDLMQGLMVDDGLKDTELLPAIVSLDEFMESLTSEPPFDILAEDAGKLSSTSEKTGLENNSGAKSAPVRTTKDVTDDRTDKNERDNKSYIKSEIDPSSIDHADKKSSDNKTDVDFNENQASLRSFDKNGRFYDNNPKSGSEPLASPCRFEHLWEGILQYNISTMTSVVGTYISGERTSAKDWPGILEIKGRVRLDAFEKFLQELPLSRSRAVMVLHFDVKEGRPESERADLKEVAESYVVDARVGIAEPGSGVEFYFCPPHPKILEMLGRILLKQHNEALNPIENGVIGVVVWRKSQLTSLSPNKRSSKKQHLSSRRQHQDTNLKSINISSPPILPMAQGSFLAVGSNPPLEEDAAADDSDDVPPGFGPPVTRDDDDLPEFSFSSGGNPSGFSATRGPSRRPSFHPVTRPVEQMRELVHKYGQNAVTPAAANRGGGFGGVAVQPWNDDDDDIPEWQPQAPPLVRGGGQQQPALRPHIMVNQQQRLGQVSQGQVQGNQQSHMQSSSGSGGGWWGVPQGQPSNLGSGGQFYHHGGTFGRGGGAGINPQQQHHQQDSSNIINSRRF